jgi:hypothetical protein
MTSPATTAPSSTSAQAPTPAPAAASAAPTSIAATAGSEIIPSATTLLQAARLAIQQDKPIQLDYYVDTANLKAFIGEDPETKEKVLVKNREEFTSLVSKMYKVGDDFLIMTENSIYIVSGKIQKRKVNLASLQGEE